MTWLDYLPGQLLAIAGVDKSPRSNKWNFVSGVTAVYNNSTKAWDLTVSGGGGGGVTDHGGLTGLSDDDHSALYELWARPIVAYSGAGSAPALADARKHITTSHGSANTFTIPPNSGIAFATGTMLFGTNIGAGTMTLTPGSGVTLNGPSLSVPTGYTWLAKKTNTDTWYCSVIGSASGSSLPSASAAGQTIIWNGSAYIAGALDLADTDAVTGSLPDARLASTFLKANGSVALSAAWDVGNQRIDDVLALSFDSEIDDGNSGTADTIDWTTGALHKSTLTGNVTYTFTAPQPHTYVQLRCVQDATGGRTVTLPVACVSLDGITWQPNPTASSISFLTLYYDGTNYYYYGRAPDSRIVTESTTARTFGLADVGAYIRTTNGSATSLTVPPNSTTAFPIGSLITGIQAGSGQITFVQGAGVTINKPASRNRKTAEQFSTWALKKVGTDEWDLCGDLEIA